MNRLFGLVAASTSTVFGRFRGGDGVDGGVIAIDVRNDRSNGDGNSAGRNINGGIYDELLSSDGTREWCWYGNIFATKKWLLSNFDVAIFFVSNFNKKIVFFF